MQPYKNIIFDLGGVFLTLDYKKTEDAFIALGARNFRSLYSQHQASALFRLLETGNISPKDFCAELRLQADFSANDDEIKKAWCAMLGYFPKERLHWLSQIKTRYNVFLFSNTNEIHLEFLLKNFEQDFGHSFDAYFIKAYYSNKLGLRKPDVRSYEKVLEEQKLTASDTLFIDDTFENIEGAKLAGLQTFYLEKPMTVLELDL
jgi:FMN phosphatase YigB (HAD superfamily)